MPEATFYGYWRKGTSKNLMEIIIEKDNLPAVKEYEKRLRKAEMKKGELRLLKLIVDYHFKQRTLDQNALMWELYTIEAYAMNAGQNTLVVAYPADYQIHPTG